jgi:hypothetical protein
MEKTDPYIITNINFNNLVYSKCKERKNKKVIYVKYQDRDKMNNFVFQLPTILNVGDFTETNNILEIDFPLYCKDTHKNNILINFFNNLDKKIISDAKLNSRQWFGDISSSKYQSIIRKTNSNNKFTKNGFLRLKILKTPDFETHIRINNKRNNFSNVKSPCWTKILLEFYAIWINENGFGGYFRPIILDFRYMTKDLYNYKLLEDSSENEDVPNDIFIKSKNFENDNLESSMIRLSVNEEKYKKCNNEALTDSSDSDNPLEFNL